MTSKSFAPFPCNSKTGFGLCATQTTQTHQNKEEEEGQTRFVNLKKEMETVTG
jgi:hypothetical protein